MIKIEMFQPPFESPKLQREKLKLQEYLKKIEYDINHIGNYKNGISSKRFNFLPIQRIDFNLYVYLSESFSNKCAYCETLLDKPYIEAIKPKSIYPHLAYDWDNLLPVCPACSHSKTNKFPVNEKDNSPLLLNPRIDDPEIHLDFLEDGTISAKSIRGHITIDTLNLNRKALVNRRFDYFEHLKASIDDFEKPNWLKTNNIITHIATRRSFIFKNFSMDLLWNRPNSKRFDLLNFLNLESSITENHFYEIYKEYNFTNNHLLIENEETHTIPRYLKSFAIENLADLNFEYTFDFSKKIPFLMVLGENGTGKTSLLQSIVISATLALNKPKGFAKRFKCSTITAKYGGIEDTDNIHIVNFNNIKPLINITENIPIAAYGAVRLIDKEHNNTKILKNQNVRNILPTSNSSYFLPHLEDWLKDEDIKQIQEALVEILPTESDKSVYLMYKENEQAFFVTFNTETHYRFDELSSGYRTIIGLVVDIMRFLLSQPNNTGRFTPGIILIDEIDVHLHPSWKIKVVELFRNTFPKIQFIMTTHDPLCLRGLEENEIIVFKNGLKEDKRIVLTENVPFQGDLKIDQILLSDLFGLNNTLDSRHVEEINSEYRLTDSQFKYFGYNTSEKMALKIIDEAIKEKKSQMDEEVRMLNPQIELAVLKLWRLND